MKRIPRIKFPKRHPQSASPDTKSTSQIASATSNQMTAGSSEVLAPPGNMAVGGKASLQPKRTPVSDGEIEAILIFGQCGWPWVKVGWLLLAAFPTLAFYEMAKHILTVQSAHS